MKCYVYLIRQGNTDRYKIGLSATPETRLSDLQTGASAPLSIANTWRFGSRDIAAAAEKMLHSQFNTCRLKGEWFLLTIRDLSLIVAIMTGFYHGLQVQKESAMVEIQEAICAVHELRREEWS